MDEYVYTEQFPKPIAGGDEPVTRQLGLPPVQQDRSSVPMWDRPIVQPGVGADGLGGSGLVERNPGLGLRFMGDGTQIADALAEGNTFHADRRVIAIGEANQPAAPPVLQADHGITADTDAGYPGHPGVVPGIPAALASGDVVASDKPLPGQEEAAPQVLSPEQLAAAKAAKKAGK